MSAFRLAGDFGKRVADLRHTLRETQAAFASRWLVGGKQISVWEHGGQAPALRKVQAVAAQQGWDMAMFAEGGPMPSTLVNRPLTGRTPAEPIPHGGVVREAVLAPYGGAARYYEGALRRLDGRVARGEEMGAEEARAMLMTLWDYAIREAPGLRPDAGPSPETIAGAQAIGEAERPPTQGRRGA